MESAEAGIAKAPIENAAKASSTLNLIMIAPSRFAATKLDE
jgi:hypothetical protein